MRRARRLGVAGPPPPADATVRELYDYGIEAQRAGKETAAVSAYHELLRRDPGHSEAHARLGEIPRGRGDAQTALLHSLQALRTDDRAETILAAADAYGKAGRPDDPIALYQDVIARDPGPVAALRALREVGVTEGRWAAAQSAQERLVTMVGEDERPAEQQWLAVIHYERGRARVAEGDHTGAIAAFRDALRARADFVPAAVALGDAFLRAGEPG